MSVGELAELTMSEPSVETYQVSVKEMAEQLGVPGGSGEYHIGRFLGSNEYLDGVRVGPGMHTALRLMLGEFHLSGSALTSGEGKASVNSGENSTLSQAMQPILTREVDRSNPLVHPEKLFKDFHQTVKMAYAEGGFKLEDMSELTYFSLHMLLGGNNLDILSEDRMGDLPGSNERLFSLIRALDCYMVMGWPRVVAQTEFHKRFVVNTIVGDGDSVSGGVNIVCFNEGSLAKDPYLGMLSYRREVQTTPLVWDEEKGMMVNINSEALREPVRMDGKPKNLGEWLMYTARAVRLVAKHGSATIALDVDSFLEKIPKDKSMNFETILGIVKNMRDAYWHDPHTVGELIERLKLEQYFHKVETPDLGEYLENAEKDLFGSLRDREEQVVVDFQGTTDRRRGFVNLSDMADLIALFMPVTLEQLKQLTPKPQDREKIECRMGGNNGTIPQINPGALGEYVVDGKKVLAAKMDMDAKIALDQIIAWAEKNPSKATQEQIESMRKDRDLLYKYAISRSSFQ